MEYLWKAAQFLCKPFKKNKKEYFENINVIDINDNKKSGRQ